MERYAQAHQQHHAALKANASAKNPVPVDMLPAAPDRELMYTAASTYRSVLKHQPNNIYAAHGVGIALAMKEKVRSACLSIMQ
jgi:hypothetical protein